MAIPIIFQYGYGSIPINTIFRGLFTSIYQLFWCELQGYKVLTHCHMYSIESIDIPWKFHGHGMPWQWLRPVVSCTKSWLVLSESTKRRLVWCSAWLLGFDREDVVGLPWKTRRKPSKILLKSCKISEKQWWRQYCCQEIWGLGRALVQS